MITADGPAASNVAHLTPERPTWRGVIHRYAALVAPFAFVALIVTAETATQRLACGVYGIGVTVMLVVSAVYHSKGISPVLRRRLRRVDHSTILLAISGSYTGIGVLALDGASERRLLVVVWVAAVLGIAVRMCWLDAPYPVIAAVYVTVGWAAIVEIGALLAALDHVETALVIGGGLVYSAGAAVYALRRPNPRPATFGYHEVFHALVVAAAALHYAAALRLAG